MKAIILAAGQGTRLKKYTQDLPKGMLFFMGKTIIERQIETYRRCGIDDIIIVRGYAADKINYDGIRYYTNYAYATTNMVASLMTVSEASDCDMIVSYSDILFEDDMLRAMMESKADFAVAVDEAWKRYWQKRYGKTDFDTESLRIDANCNITELGKENPPLEDISARYVGLLKFTKTGFDVLRGIWQTALRYYADKPWQQSGKTAPKAYMTDILNAVIESGQPVKAEKFNNGWIEFDTNEDYENAIQWTKDGSLDEIIMLKDNVHARM